MAVALVCFGHRGPQPLGEQETNFWAAGVPQLVGQSGCSKGHEVHLCPCCESPGNKPQGTGELWLVQGQVSTLGIWRSLRLGCQEALHSGCAAAAWAEDPQMS